MKKVFLLMLIFTVVILAVNKENFVLNVFNDEYPVKEIDGKVTIPFDSEYCLFLRNGNDRDCTAKIWIDGALVSNFRDFIIEANSELNLERFVTESMQEGKRFKFVLLDNPEVDDPERKENGIVKVEFRLEKQYKYIAPDFRILEYKNIWQSNGNINTTLEFDGNSGWSRDSNINCSVTCSSSSGATIAGSESKQSFHYANIDVENEPTILTLKIMGIN